MKKPYKGDYKPDYDYWKKIHTDNEIKKISPASYFEGFFIILVSWVLLCVISFAGLFSLWVIFEGGGWNIFKDKTFFFKNFFLFFQTLFFNRYFIYFIIASIIFTFFCANSAANEVTKERNNQCISNINNNPQIYKKLAEDDAERKYQEDLDRWYHYQDAEDEVEDRKLARDLKKRRAMGQIDDERLIYQYSQLQAIQNHSNQQAVEFFQQAQQALRYDRKSDLDYSLDQLERALGV